MSEQTKNPNLPDIVVEAKQLETKPLTFEDKAHAMLSTVDYNMLKAYMDGGNLPLSDDTAGAFFNLFLNGYDTKEIWKMNKAFRYETIVWARIKFDWDRQKEEHVAALTVQIRDKVQKSQLEMTGLLADLMSVAAKQHGEKIKRYLQTGNAKDLEGALGIDSIASMSKIIEGLAKITGQDRMHKVKTENTQNLNVNVQAGAQSEDMLSPEAAATILAAVAEDKRKKRETKS